jgi:hypothetical protein
MALIQDVIVPEGKGVGSQAVDAAENLAVEEVEATLLHRRLPSTAEGPAAPFSARQFNRRRDIPLHGIDRQWQRV